MSTIALYHAFAPLQGYTDAAYRQAHMTCAGGVDEYYTPFVRMEKGEVRKKDLRDTDPINNKGVPTVPQVIAADKDEFARLCDILQEQNYHRIDFNMGCPFPMQVKRGRGSGLLQHPDRVEEIALEMKIRKEVQFSVKMRMGQECIDEGLTLMPIINDMPLVHVTLHPRLGQQQYKGLPDKEAFAYFMDICRQPMVFNGDITTIDQIYELKTAYPLLKGVMIGRGLLAHPWMLSDKEPGDVLLSIHKSIYQHAVQTLCGDSQTLSYLNAFWEYVDIDRKNKKAIQKATTLHRYDEAVATLLQGQTT